MKSFGVAALALATLLSATLPPESHAAAGVIRVLGKVGSHTDELSDLARANAAVRRLETVSPEIHAMMKGGRKDELLDAYRRVQAASESGEISIDMRAFDALLGQSPAKRAEWADSVPLSDDLPNVRIRAPNSAAAAALRLFAKERLDDVLSEAFDAQDLKIVVAGLADDGERSAVELAAFRRAIPRSQWDEVGSLPRIGTGPTDRAALADQLRIYRGKTIVIVGHVPEGSMDFILHLPDGTTRALDIKPLLEAAAEAGVNLIPIGCNSERMGPIGARGLLNSRRIRSALRNVIDQQPRTTSEFLRALTAQDLDIVIDPLGSRMFSNGMEIRSRRNAETVGRIVVTGGRSSHLFEAEDEQGFATPSLARAADSCFAASTSTAFDACAGSVHSRNAAFLRATERTCIAHNLKVLPDLVREAHARATSSMLYGWLSSLLFGAAAAFFAWLALVARNARQDEQDYGRSVSHLVNRWRRREVAGLLTRRSMGDVTIGTDRTIFAILIAGLASGLLIAPVSAWYVAAFYAVVVIGLVGTMLEYGKRMFTRRSLVDASIALTAVVVTITGLNHVAAASTTKSDRLMAGSLESSLLAHRARTLTEACTRYDPHLAGYSEIPAVTVPAPSM